MDYNQNQQNFSRYTVIDSVPASGTGTVARKFMANVFLWMFVALGISALCAYLFASSNTLLSLLYTQTERGMSMSGFGYLVMFAPIGFVLLMSFGYTRLSSVALAGLFLVYAAVMGMSLSVILLIYTAGSVLTCFISASAMFGVMAILGYTTEKDLTSFGRILTMGLFGIIIASVVNFFFQSPGLYYIISFIGVAVFTGLTAYDVQKLKRIGAGMEYGDVSANDTSKLAVMGALSLYLDFINLFLMLLRLFGNRRD